MRDEQGKRREGTVGKVAGIKRWWREALDLSLWCQD